MRFIDVMKSRQGRPLDFDALPGQVEGLAKDFRLILLYIYGSYAGGVPSRLSDIDIAFLSVGRLAWRRQLELCAKLEEILEEEAIDLVDLSRVPLTLIHRILKFGRCVYARSLSQRIDFEVRKEDLYLDTAPLRRDYERGLLERLENGRYGYR